MHFERVSNPEPDKPRYVITIEREEIEVVAAAFKEHIARLISLGNMGSVRDFQEYMANASDNAVAASKDSKTPRHVRARVHNYEQSIVSVLEEFVENTPDAVREIVDITGVPPFLNDDILLRMRYAKGAQRLVDEIRHEAQTGIEPVQDEEAVIEEFRRQLDKDHGPFSD